MINTESSVAVKALYLCDPDYQTVSSPTSQDPADSSFDILLCRGHSDIFSGEKSHRPKLLIKNLTSLVKPTLDPFVPAKT